MDKEIEKDLQKMGEKVDKLHTAVIMVARFVLHEHENRIKPNDLKELYQVARGELQ